MYLLKHCCPQICISSCSLHNYAWRCTSKITALYGRLLAFTFVTWYTYHYLTSRRKVPGQVATTDTDDFISRYVTKKCYSLYVLNDVLNANYACHQL